MALAADALTKGNSIPDPAVKLAARVPLPKGLYLFILNAVFRRVAKKYGKAPIDARPYQ